MMVELMDQMMVVMSAVLWDHYLAESLVVTMDVKTADSMDDSMAER